MSVVTISNEFGSLGSIIAENTAKELGYHLTDKSTVEAMFKEFGMPSLQEEYESIPGFWDRFAVEKKNRRQNLLSMLDHSLCAMARFGDVVIVGRGGFAVLAGLADVLNVRIQAPAQLRMHRLVDSPAIGDPDMAERAIRNNDQLKKTFVKSVYGREWDSASAYDLVIDTGKIAPDLATDMIVKATKALNVTGKDGERTTADLHEDKMLIAAVDEALNSSPH